MHILEMQAAYGRLRGDSLRLEPGLNLIYAPNESGKSTWCSFIRTMLYGLPTRQSGPLADKNRFAPWTGEAMQGRMDLETDGRRWTVLRDTRRVNAPMQNFACTYTGTAQPVPEVNGQNLGETLLGVPREVFQRSAFIGQSGLAVSQDPELERRIAALLSTGQEDVSYSESYDRLKKQLNRRRHNKTGLIPQLEQEQARLDDALRRQAELTAQLENAREQQCTAQTRVEELEQRRAQWEALEKQEALRQWRAKNSLTEYYYVGSLENYDEVYRACAYFSSHYGKIDWSESENEYWLELEATLRRDFNVTTGPQIQDMRCMKFKSAMKEVYKSAGLKGIIN